MSNEYHETRLSEDPKRKVLWGVLAKHLQKYCPENATILDFGAGYCDFINLVKAENKFAYDIWDGIKDYADKNVELIIGNKDNFEALNSIPDSSLDVIFASNIFEHFSVDQLDDLFVLLKKKLKNKGVVIALQPNFYYAFRQYFDDYTHKSIWTHISLADFFKSKGFQTVDVKPKFMPLTVKSRLPVNAFLINLYLKSPIKPISGQMLVVSQLLK